MMPKGDTSRCHGTMEYSPRKPDRTIRIVSSEDHFLRAARADIPHMQFAPFGPIKFLSHLRSLRRYDEPEILHVSLTPICLMNTDAGHARGNRFFICWDAAAVSSETGSEPSKAPPQGQSSPTIASSQAIVLQHELSRKPLDLLRNSG